MVIVVLLIAMVGKIGGSYWGARLMKMKKRESAAVGFGMSAQGGDGDYFGAGCITREP